MENSTWHALLADAENRVDLGLPATDPRVVIQTGHTLMRVIETQLEVSARVSAYDRALAYLALAATRDDAKPYGEQFDFLLAQTMGLQGLALQQTDPPKALSVFRQIIEHGQTSGEANLRRTGATAGYFAGALATELGEFADSVADYRVTCAFTRDVADDLAYSRKLFTAARLNHGFVELEHRAAPELAVEIFGEIVESYQGYARDTAILGLDTNSRSITAAQGIVKDAPLDEETGEHIPVEHPAFSHAFAAKLPSVESMLEIAVSNRRIATARAKALNAVDSPAPMTDTDRADLRQKLNEAVHALDSQQPNAAFALIEPALGYHGETPDDESMLAEAYSVAHAALRGADEHERSLEAGRALVDRFGSGAEQKAVARAVFRMALTLDRLNRPSEELKAYKALAARWADSPDPEVRFWVARAQHYTGLTVKRSGDYMTALNYFERSLEFIGEEPTGDLELVAAEVLRDVAATHRELENVELEVDAVERLRETCGNSQVVLVREIVNVELARHGMPLVESMATPSTPTDAVAAPRDNHSQSGLATSEGNAAVNTVVTEAAPTRRPWWKFW